jgi:hypothetical protein
VAYFSGMDMDFFLEQELQRKDPKEQKQDSKRGHCNGFDRGDGSRPWCFLAGTLIIIIIIIVIVAKMNFETPNIKPLYYISS